ncbi:MAG: hypothetical protein IT425_14650 [Pirellulales bacterium]|nr:hypothetical protein [Pirellulales bacterium]
MIRNPSSKDERQRVMTSLPIYAWPAVSLLKRAEQAVALLAVFAVGFFLAGVNVATAQVPGTGGNSGSLPEPIFWKQQLFLIPYQWSSSSDPAAAQSVRLFVSRDQGGTWQKISEAQPHVKAFNYRAEGEGEYWFAVRTIDSYGRSLPAGPMQAELRVVVDTTIPRIDTVRAWQTPSGLFGIQCLVADAHLDPATLRVETQSGPSGAWQVVALQDLKTDAVSAATQFQAGWASPADGRSTLVRVTVSDRAGNSAVYQTSIGGEQETGGPVFASPHATPVGTGNTIPGGSANGGLESTTVLGAIGQPAAIGAGSNELATSSSAAATAPAPPNVQSWPANGIATAPLQLWTRNSFAAADGVTSYGNPPIGSRGAGLGDTASTSPLESTPGGLPMKPANSSIEPRVPAHYASGSSMGAPIPSSAAIPQAAEEAAMGPMDAASNGGAGGPTNRPRSTPKLVGSRTFALEYDLNESGQGISRVELWGTRDGGSSWYRYGVDDDSRSPLVVTVDEEGLYGFRIVVQSAGAAMAAAPQPGESPELWVAVDLKRPLVEINGLERGEGNLSDHLILRWRVEDNNLEARPISLYFSSRPNGPWSAIATNLADTGEYSWRVERYVPSRIYLRLEARDTAGNLSAFQTREPLEFQALPSTGALRSAAANAN